MQTKDKKNIILFFINECTIIVIPICLEAKMEILKCLSITRIKLKIN
jgi:hypothetical protein